jgi:hypothetical protein
VGYNWIQHLLQGPHLALVREVDAVRQLGHFVGVERDVAVQVAFEKANFETGFSLYRFKG